MHRTYESAIARTLGVLGFTGSELEAANHDKKEIILDIMGRISIRTNKVHEDAVHLFGDLVICKNLTKERIKDA